MMARRTAMLTAAAITSAVGVLMAAAAAADRAATPTDQALITAVACVLVLGAHLLPAITRSAAGWALWVCCLALTAWGHTTFFCGAASRAGEARAHRVPTTTQAQTLRDELQAIQARPLAIVAADLAAAQGREITASAAATRCAALDQAQPRQGATASPTSCTRQQAAASTARATSAALADELAQARYAGTLRQQITASAGELDASRSAAAIDPVGAALAAATGWPASAWTTGAAVLSAVMVELMAALLWAISLQHSQAVATATATPADSSTQSPPSVPRMSTNTRKSQASR